MCVGRETDCLTPVIRQHEILKAHSHVGAHVAGERGISFAGHHKTRRLDVHLEPHDYALAF